MTNGKTNSTNNMREFYNLFPYPYRPFFVMPNPRKNLLAHLGFFKVLQQGKFKLAREIWSSARAKNNLSLIKDFLKQKDLAHILNKQIVKDSHILLVGCGTDEPLLFSLLHPNSKITAVDLSKKSLQIAKTKVLAAKFRRLFKSTPKAQINFIEADATNYLNNNKIKFDYIQCFGVLHHQGNPTILFNQMHNCLSENGFIRLMVYNNVGRRLERRIQNKHQYLWNKEKQNTFGKHFLLKLNSTKLWLWMIYSYFRKNIGYYRFKYTNLSRAALADAFLHPSDPGLSLTQLNDLITAANLNVVFCEAKTYEKKWIVGLETPKISWEQIMREEENIATNIILVLRK